MILTDKFVDDIQVLDQLTDEVYEKVVNFGISYIAKHDTQTTLAGKAVMIYCRGA